MTSYVLHWQMNVNRICEWPHPRHPSASDCFEYAIFYIVYLFFLHNDDVILQLKKSINVKQDTVLTYNVSFRSAWFHCGYRSKVMEAGTNLTRPYLWLLFCLFRINFKMTGLFFYIVIFLIHWKVFFCSRYFFNIFWGLESVLILTINKPIYNKCKV